MLRILHKHLSERLDCFINTAFYHIKFTEFVPCQDMVPGVVNSLLKKLHSSVKFTLFLIYQTNIIKCGYITRLHLKYKHILSECFIEVLKSILYLCQRKMITAVTRDKYCRSFKMFHSIVKVPVFSFCKTKIIMSF